MYVGLMLKYHWEICWTNYTYLACFDMTYWIVRTNWAICSGNRGRNNFVMSDPNFLNKLSNLFKKLLNLIGYVTSKQANLLHFVEQIAYLFVTACFDMTYWIVRTNWAICSRNRGRNNFVMSCRSQFLEQIEQFVQEIELCFDVTLHRNKSVTSSQFLEWITQFGSYL